MDKLRFHLMLITFILIFLQKYAQGIKCLQCYNCNHTGIAENSTCVVDGRFCVSSSEREKVKDNEIVIGYTDVIKVTHGCLKKDLYTMCDLDGMKHVQNFRCCRDNDLCNIEILERVPWPYSMFYKKHTGSGDSMATEVFIFGFFMIALTISIVLFFVSIFIYVKDLVRPYAPPPDQNIDPNPLMGSQPSSLKVLYNCSQSGSDSGIFEESVGTSSGHPFQTDGRI